MAISLKREFERQGHPVILQCFREWYNGADSDCDTVIVLRGLYRYRPNPGHYNILWNISHPQKVSIAEYSQYDYVLIASKLWARVVQARAEIPVEAMLQCTDPETFKPYRDEAFRHELLFVGNTRGYFRKIIHDVLPTNRELAVYGRTWDRLIDSKYIKGSYIPNHELYKYYGSCDILLNDHHKDMRQSGFINNRVFDGLACGAFILSDHVDGLSEILEDTVVTYHTRDELAELIEHYLSNPELRKKKAELGTAVVRNHHTFSNRVDRFLEIIREGKKG